jgi:hypothetical protein
LEDDAFVSRQQPARAAKASNRRLLHDSTTEDSHLLAAKLSAETAKIRWRELQRFFAQGRAIQVAASLDLIDVAARIGSDDARQVEAWMNAGKVQRVSDHQARQWIDADALVWAVVVRPWVLVQPLTDA